MDKKNKSSKSSESSSGRGRKRAFATVVYPESAPDDWIDTLSNLHVPALANLHDGDSNPDGEVKKHHYHVMLMFDTVKNFETQVKPIFDKIGAVGREEVNSVRGYARYMCHLDNPEKHQYDPAGVMEFGGANYLALIHLPTDDMRTLQDIFHFIRENHIYSFAQMLDICSANNPEWFNTIAMNRAYVVDKYIKSICWEDNQNYGSKNGGSHTNESND